jgi:hypothetical protein
MRGRQAQAIQPNRLRSLAVEPQVFVGSEPRPELLKPIANNLHHCKPVGGLWTSSVNKGRSVWSEHVCAEGGSWKLEVSKKARVFTVSKESDEQLLAEAYPPPATEMAEIARQVGVPSILSPICDWEKLSQDYDGLQVSPPILRQLPWSMWDVESTVWFRWVFENIEAIS